MDILIIRWGFLDVSICEWYLGATFFEGHGWETPIFGTTNHLPNPKFISYREA